MSRTIAALVLVGVIGASTTAFGATPGIPGDDRRVEQSPPAPSASHAIRGRVKSVGATSLVITRSNGRRSDLAFVLDGSTLREGTIAVGATVSVRYRIDGNAFLATAVTSRVGPH